MAKKYGQKASQKVQRAMKEMKAGKLKSGRSGQKVTSRKQAIAIGLSEAREEGGKVPPREPGSKSTGKSAPKRRSTSVRSKSSSGTSSGKKTGRATSRSRTAKATSSSRTSKSSKRVRA